MKVALSGPDDLGYWYLEDANNSNVYKFVRKTADLFSAARLFGWNPKEDEAVLEAAEQWLKEEKRTVFGDGEPLDWAIETLINQKNEVAVKAAQDHLVFCIGDSIEAPDYVAEYFQDLSKGDFRAEKK